MCLDEYFGLRRHQWDLKILATDISFNALKSASNGVYPESALENIPDKWREKYFCKADLGDYKVVDEIRSNVAFKYHNLMEDISFKRNFHLIFCRNVMIYFNEETKSKLCRKFYNATELGGYLYIGHAESSPADMPYRKIANAVYKKDGERR
jgi:chemotaxis protein methyltransferase CheR